MFEITLNQASLIHSYSRKGHPCDNGRLQSYHSLRKKELINQHTYSTLDEVRLKVSANNHFYTTECETNGRGGYKPKKEWPKVIIFQCLM
nr:integrase core domain-containing protein [Levilactobacillus brevis]